MHSKRKKKRTNDSSDPEISFSDSDDSDYFALKYNQPQKPSRWYIIFPQSNIYFHWSNIVMIFCGATAILYPTLTAPPSAASKVI